MNRLIFLVFLICAAVAWEGCKGSKAGEGSAAKVEVPEDFQVIFSRGGCRGQCPIYTLFVDAQGNVKYQGEAFVDHVGKFEKKISQAKVKELVQAFKDASYFEMSPTYDDPQVMDAPRMVVECRMDGQSHKVIDRFDAPEALKTLEKKIDEIVGNEGYTEVK